MNSDFAQNNPQKSYTVNSNNRVQKIWGKLRKLRKSYTKKLH